MEGKELIMDLTLEQGVPRHTQVQPPLDVWKEYFEFNFHQSPPELKLRNRHPRGPAESRRIVAHHHNWTLEFSGADVERPAILRMRRTSNTGLSYDYWIYPEDDPNYDYYDRLLKDYGHRAGGRGRRWLIL